MMSEEETIRKCIIYCKDDDHMLKNQRDIDAYIRDNMNVKMPMDGPLWRIYVQDYDPTDETDIKGAGLSMFKAHHSLCDGVSIMCMILAMGEDFSRDYFVPVKDAKWYEAVFVRIISIF